MKNILRIAVLALMPVIAAAQSNNVQSAWRAYDDYIRSAQEGKPDMDYLNKAKEKIDLAQAHADTKDKPKTLMYVCKIYYSLFQSNWTAEKKKLEGSITNKNELAEMAYGNVSTKEFVTSADALGKVFQSEEKQADKPYTMELGQFALNMLADMQNLAIGRFKVKKYDEAMELFSDNYNVYKTMGKKDTSLIFYSLIAAERGKKPEKVLAYGKVMMDDKVANAETFNKMHFAYLEMKDTANAEKVLNEGLMAYPNDKALMLNFINIYLQQKKEAKAMDYIDKAIAKDPKICALYLVKGNVYNEQANPKETKKIKMGMSKKEIETIMGKPSDVKAPSADNGQMEVYNYPRHAVSFTNGTVAKIKGDTVYTVDLPKPANFEDLMTKAETNYLKMVECDPNAYDGNFNMGTVYNNLGNMYDAKADPKHPEYGKKAKEYWMKAIIYLEKCDSLKPCDKDLMKYIARLYTVTDQNDKAAPLREKIKNGCK